MTIFPRYYLLARDEYICGNRETVDVNFQSDIDLFILKDNPYNIETKFVDVYEQNSFLYRVINDTVRKIRQIEVDGQMINAVDKNNVPYIDEIGIPLEIDRQSNRTRLLEKILELHREVYDIQDVILGNYENRVNYKHHDKRLAIRVDNAEQYFWLIETQGLEVFESSYEFRDRELSINHWTMKKY